MKQNTVLLSGLALIVIVAFGTMFMTGSGLFSTTDEGIPATVQTDAGAGNVVCESGTTPDLLVRAYDFYNVGTAITEGGTYREKGTKTWTDFVVGTPITGLKVGSDYEIVAGLNSTDNDDMAYGPHVFSGALSCSETPSIEIAMYNDELETSVSATFYNADGDASAETFSAGQTQTVSLKLLTGTDEVYGNPFILESAATGNEGQRAAYPNVVCLDLNTTSWDAPEKVEFDGEEMKKVNTPQAHTGSAATNTYCYEAPILTDSLMEQNRYFLRLNNDDTAATFNDNTGYIYSADYYIDSDDGNVKWGVEDEDGDLIGAGAADSVTLDFSA